MFIINYYYYYCSSCAAEYLDHIKQINIKSIV